MLTVADWSALPDTKPHYELLQGQLVQKPMTKRKRSKAATQLLVECVIWGRASGWQFFAEGTGTRIDERNGFVPDVAGIAPGQAFNPEAAVETFAPAFVAEVLPRRTAKADRTTKRDGYARIGVQTYVLVDTEKKTLGVYPLEGETYGPPLTLRDDAVWEPDALPGLRVELTRLWF